MKIPRYLADPKTCIQRLQQDAISCKKSLRDFATEWDLPISDLPESAPDKLRLLWRSILGEHNL